MSVFANYRADRLIAEIKTTGNPNSPQAQKAFQKLLGLGPSAIEPIIDALSNAEKRETIVYVEILAKLIDARTLPQVLQGHGRGQRAGDLGHRLGAVLEPQLPGGGSPRCAEQGGYAKTGDSRRHHRAESPLFRARPAERRLCPGAYRARRALQDHRRDRRRVLDRRFGRAHRGQGPGGAPAHHPGPRTLQHPDCPAGGAEAAQGQQQAGPLCRAVCPRAHGRTVRHAADHRHAARRRDRGAEQGRRRGDQGQSSRHHQVPGRGAQGRERVCAARRGRGFERHRQPQGRQVPARGDCRQRLVGADPRGRRAREDRRPEGGGCRSRPHQGRESGHSPGRDRDSESDQGRARGRSVDRGDQGPRLVGERAGGGCARGDRQHEGAASVHRDAAGRAQISADGGAGHRQSRRPEEHRALDPDAAALRERGQTRSHRGDREARR